ncbi:PAS domain S-box protein [Microvirga tunisiensis]|uniref:histidine kinase n=2 Tax=Pannonibacter tanglangensis TaxID=2750084 RepID=A0A7X5F3Z1_9HYPH|nr:PAS domain S-box protein [Pannonibacter sp. XCT-53]
MAADLAAIAQADVETKPGQDRDQDQDQDQDRADGEGSDGAGVPGTALSGSGPATPAAGATVRTEGAGDAATPPETAAIAAVAAPLDEPAGPTLVSTGAQDTGTEDTGTGDTGTGDTGTGSATTVAVAGPVASATRSDPPAQVMSATVAALVAGVQAATSARSAPPVAPDTVAPAPVAPDTVAPETLTPETLAPDPVALETQAEETSHAFAAALLEQTAELAGGEVPGTAGKAEPAAAATPAAAEPVAVTPGDAAPLSAPAASWLEDLKATSTLKRKPEGDLFDTDPAAAPRPAAGSGQVGIASDKPLPPKEIEKAVRTLAREFDAVLERRAARQAADNAPQRGYCEAPAPAPEASRPTDSADAAPAAAEARIDVPGTSLPDADVQAPADAPGLDAPVLESPVLESPVIDAQLEDAPVETAPAEVAQAEFAPAEFAPVHDGTDQLAEARVARLTGADGSTPETGPDAAATGVAPGAALVAAPVAAPVMALVAAALQAGDNGAALPDALSDAMSDTLPETLSEALPEPQPVPDAPAASLADTRSEASADMAGAGTPELPAEGAAHVAEIPEHEPESGPETENETENETGPEIAPEIAPATGRETERERGTGRRAEGQVVPFTGPGGTHVPRLVPVDTSRLTKPERAAFRKIAEALGARLEGDFEEEEDEAPAALLQPDPAAAAAAPAEPQRPVAPPAEPIDPRLLDRLPIGIGIVRDREVLYANETLLALLGYPHIEALEEAGGFEAMFVDPEHLPGDRLEGTIDEAMILRRANGRLSPVDARMHTVPWNGGRGLMVSIVERPQPVAAPSPDTDLALSLAREQIAEMDTILETATDGVLLLDRFGTILKANGSAEALFGAARPDLVGAPLTAYLAPESHRSALDYLDGLARNGVASVLNDGREVIGQVSSGGLIPLFMTIGRLGSGEGLKFCAVLRDITQWKAAEEELTKAKRQAENASSQKSDFLAKISHEIRTPLNAIIGFSEVMIEERFGAIGNERYKEYLKDIRTSGSHIMSLINDLLDLSKIEAGKLDLTFEAVSANDIVRECVALMQPQANRERVIIRASLPGTVPHVVADLRSLRQIVLNLLSNAIKFNKSGGQVIVSTALETSGEVVLRVRDTGTGMNAKDLAAALEPFRQVHTARHGGGTGLGLPLTKALVEANRAGFKIDSVPDQGTLVEITFPPQRVLAE